MIRPGAATLLIAALCAPPATAAPEGYFKLAPGVTLESGETWHDGAGRYRLFGVQSCLRGTTFTNRTGEQQDCGEASIAVFAAFITDTTPICAPVVKAPELTFVMCYATINREQVDLGTLLINNGYHFAALDRNGLPQYMNYAVAEQLARDNRAGLWQFPDVQHPAILLGRASRERPDQ
ncbi:MAG: thermonuclease family protein [Mesorhizobium sp.]|nr:thermonuclease family protein [Mesorhizobium sp.]MCO5164599.1 thermonuclease family protein [Mesorhizobium sp.]